MGIEIYNILVESTIVDSMLKLKTIHIFTFSQ